MRASCIQHYEPILQRRLFLKQTLRIAVLMTFACAGVVSLSNSAQGQKVDFAFGVSTMDAPGASSADSSHTPVSLTGGAYPGFSGDVLFWHNLGIGAEIYWKANQRDYAGDPTQPFRPIFLDFNAVY